MQVVDLQRDEAFRSTNVELLSIASDPPEAWAEVVKEEGIELPVLSDPETRVSSSYDVMQWQMMGEPGHTFVLVDEEGVVRWIRDYGAPESGGLMYVEPDELVPQIQTALRG